MYRLEHKLYRPIHKTYVYRLEHTHVYSKHRLLHNQIME